MSNEQIIQGDVYLVKAQIPADVTLQDHLTLALGEATGHHHSVIEANHQDAELYISANGTLYLRAFKEVIIEHQEHKPINVPTGNYIVGIQNEYDPFSEETRRVRD